MPTMPNDTIAPERARDTRERADIELAVAALHPERFGLRRHRDGWREGFPGLGDVVFAPLGWQHAQCMTYDLVDGRREPLDALTPRRPACKRDVWGMPPEELVPVNILAILPDTGGSVLVAYREDAGFNADGWLGFAIAAGGRSGTLVSHMLGVREEQRGTRDLGWHLKLLQGYEALRAGHRSAIWTFDPMRGANARLNLEKLGATVRELTLDKYGVLQQRALRRRAERPLHRPLGSGLGGRRMARLEDVRTGRYLGPDPDDVRTFQKSPRTTRPSWLGSAPAAARYRIPADIDELMTVDADRANVWRSEMRAALSPFMTIKSAAFGEARLEASPMETGVNMRPGAYDVVAFATEGELPAERENWYVLRRRGGESVRARRTQRVSISRIQRPSRAAPAPRAVHDLVRHLRDARPPLRRHRDERRLARRRRNSDPARSRLQSRGRYPRRPHVAAMRSSCPASRTVQRETGADRRHRRTCGRATPGSRARSSPRAASKPRCGTSSPSARVSRSGNSGAASGARSRSASASAARRSTRCSTSPSTRSDSAIAASRSKSGPDSTTRSPAPCAALSGHPAPGRCQLRLHHGRTGSACKPLDELDLLLIEQPLFDDDIVLHSEISRELRTPICLDESIHSLRDTQAAATLWERNDALDRLIINIKPPRVSGFAEAIEIASYLPGAGNSTPGSAACSIPPGARR